MQKEDVDLENKNTQEGGKDTVEIVEDKSIISKEVSTSERGSSAGQGEPPLDSQDDFQQPDKQSDESEVAAISRRGTESVEEDEGIGLDGGELNSEQEEEVEMDVHQTAEMEETEKALQQGTNLIILTNYCAANVNSLWFSGFCNIMSLTFVSMNFRLHFVVSFHLHTLLSQGVNRVA